MKKPFEEFRSFEGFFRFSAGNGLKRRRKHAIVQIVILRHGGSHDIYCVRYSMVR